MEKRAFLTKEDLERRAPSVFAEKPIEAVSERYCFVPTVRVVEALEKRNWLPVSADQTRARTPEGMPYKKHLLRFGNPNLSAAGGVLPEIVLFNSHDRTSSFCLMSGLFRMICLNGLMVFDDMFSVFLVRHIGYKDREIYEAEARLAGEIPLIMRRISEFESTELTWPERTHFAFSAANMRWKENMPNIDPLELLFPRREEDRKPTLWRTYNVIQENLCKGGVAGYSRNSRRRISTREIKSVAEQVRVNQSLWQIAERIRKNKEEKG